MPQPPTSAGATVQHVSTSAAVDAMPGLAWVFDRPRRALSSAPVGGGLATINWVVNARVAPDYDRQDLDAHAAEIAAHLGLGGSGVTLFTAAAVSAVERHEAGRVVVHATVGIGKPTWAADVGGGWNHPDVDLTWRPGTINLLIEMPVALHESAAVNAVITSTEAKTQALLEMGVPGTGTASDATVVCWPVSGADSDVDADRVAFCGPRSEWGSRLAIATHAAVRAGIAAQRASALRS